VKNEKTTAVNIKNNSNRKSVLAALRKLESAVKTIRSIPDNGIAIYVGADFDTVIIYPPRKIKSFIYRCGKNFVLDPIIELYKQPHELYGLLKVRGEKCIIQTVNEYYEVKTINSKTAKIQKRQKKGGQSQNRIQRLRVETIHNYLKAIAERACDAYLIDGVPIVKALLICGPGQKKEQLIPYLEKLGITCYVETTDIPTSASCNTSLSPVELNHVQHMISSENSSTDEKHVSDILELLELNPEILVFGRQHIDKAQKNKQLSHVYSNKELPYETIRVNHHLLDSFDGCIGVLYYSS